MTFPQEPNENKESEKINIDPDDQGNTCQGMYVLMRCPLPSDS